MKKVLFPIFALVLALGLALPMAAPVAAHTAEEPYTTPLMAGQNIGVGEVLVWNDGDNLYVQYVVDDPWEMTDSHLYVGKTDPASFPSTPGQFPYSPDMEKSPSEGASYDDGTMTYTIPLDEIYEYEFVGEGKGKGLNATVDPGVVAEDLIYVAAHAVVQQTTVITEAPYYATAVTSTNQGSKKDGSAVDPIRSNPDSVLVYEGSPSAAEHFFSLGFGEEFGGEIVVEFGCPIHNGDGDDLRIIEDTWGSYPSETADVYASQDDVNWTYLGSADNIGREEGDNQHTFTYFDLGDLDWATYVKVVDTTDPALHNSHADGYDLNAVEALQNCIEIQEETAWGDGTQFGTNWAMYFGYTVQGEVPVEWPEGGTLSVAFEDLPLGSGNDWDYNDWVADIDTVATFWGTSELHDDLIEMQFTIRPETRIAGYTHVMHLAADVFDCNGTYELYRDGSLMGSAVYDDQTGLDVVVVPNTGGPPGEVVLTISFDEGCEFSFPDWNENLYHGENLFFDPYIIVKNTGEEIHTGDVRMLTVPIDWEWPTPDRNAIWNPYPKVEEGNPPTFCPYWWTT